jgi:hypothetical protein
MSLRLTSEPSYGSNYYAVSLTNRETVIHLKWEDMPLDKLLLERGFCYEFSDEGKLEALRHADKLLKIDPNV